MTVKKLIKELKDMPQDSDVKVVINDTEGKLIDILFETGNNTVWLEGEMQMTVKELKKLLDKYDDDTCVCIEYADGDWIESLELTKDLKMCEEFNTVYIRGEH